MIKIGSNIFALVAERHLSRSSSTVASASEKLSSGQRINSASDDAAGLAISTSLKTDTRIYNQAIRNLNDGISAVSIAEGAMTELSGIIGRIEELAAQGANGAYSDTQRAALQKEVTALQAEWNRVVEGTSFNGRSLLTGADSRFVLQGGKGEQSTLGVQIGLQATAGASPDFAGQTTRASTSSSGGQSNGSSNANSISADGRYIAFNTNSTSFVSGDTNGAADVYVKDSITGALQLVSSTASGQFGNGASNKPSISADGRYVAFFSTSSDLVSGDTNGVADIFVKDLTTGSIVRASTNSSGAEQLGGAAVNSVAISADGRYVVFESDATNLVSGDTNGTTDVFVKDLVTGTLTRASTSSSGTQATGVSTDVSISANGRYVSFTSTANNLVSGDAGNTDIFVKDLQTGELKRVSTSSNSTAANNNSSLSMISSDGNYVAFLSQGTNLVQGDTNGQQDAFVKNLTTGEVVRASIAADGTQGNGASLGVSISADGRFVAMYSAANNLGPSDTNGAGDVYRKDLLTGNVALVSQSTTGTQGTTGSFTQQISADGRYVTYVSSASEFVSGDTNGTQDVFLRDLSTAGLQGLAGLVVSDQASAKVTLDMAKNIRENLVQQRAQIGASTTRINALKNVLSATALNYESANGRILDVDVADEVARLVSAQIRQQVGASILAQASTVPNLALRLLN